MTTSPAASSVRDGMEVPSASQEKKTVLDRVFALTHAAALNRSRWLVILLGVILVSRGMGKYTLETWQIYVRNIFVSLLGTDPAAMTFGDALTQFVSLLFSSIVNAGMLRFILVLGFPIFLAHWLAGIYLDDLFELQDPRIARRFIRQAAFSGGYQKLRISAGEVAEKDKLSPLVLIGGPGIVQVALDSAALFEKPDGSYRIISSAASSTGSNTQILDGFERLRMVVDLRDQITEGLSVEARSRDGIMVSIRDVRMIYSVWRGETEIERKASLERPYPFKEDAVRRIVYEQVCPVTPGQSNPQSCPPWQNSMPGLIRGDLAEFISSRSLSEFLANIGQPEVTSLGRREMEIAETTRDLTGDKAVEVPASDFEPGNFVPREKITDYFFDFESSFQDKSRNRGVQLRWVGVGAWSTPSEIIIDNHLQAWQISRENYNRGRKQALDDLEKETLLSELLRQIQESPLATFRRMRQDGMSHPEIVNRLFQDFFEGMRFAFESYLRVEDIPPASLFKAIQIMNGIKAHWVKGSDQVG